MGLLKNLFGKKAKEEPKLPLQPPSTGWRTVDGKDVYYTDNKPLTGTMSGRTPNRQHTIKVFIGGERIGSDIILGKGYNVLSNKEDSARQYYALEAAQKALREGKTDEFESIKAKAVEEYNVQKTERQKAKELNKPTSAEKIDEMRRNISESKETSAPIAPAPSENKASKYPNGKFGHGFHTSCKGY